MARDVNREAKILMKKARNNTGEPMLNSCQIYLIEVPFWTVTFESFSFADACRSPKRYAETQDPAAEPLREWMDGEKRIALSSDNVPILVHLPSGFLPRAEVRTPSWTSTY